MINARKLLVTRQITNREIGRQKLRLQLLPTENISASRIGYDASSGRYTIQSTDGSLSEATSLTNAPIPIGRVIGVSAGAFDGVPQ